MTAAVSRYLAKNAEPIGDFMATERIEKNARQGSASLLAAILKAQGVETQQAPAPQLTVGDLAEVLASAFTGRLTVNKIQQTVASFYGVSQQLMVEPDGPSGSRASEISHPRQVAMFFARELTGMSYPDIGRRFGNRDHTTVLHAMKAVRKRFTVKPMLALEMEVLRIRLTGGMA